MNTKTSCKRNLARQAERLGSNRAPIGWWAVCNLLLPFVVVATVNVGCGKKDKPPEIKPEQVAPINPETPADAQEKARLQQAVAIREGIEPPPPAIRLRGGELATPEVLAAYNQELLRYIVRTKDTPESLQELMRIRELPRLPTPPPGKRIVYDPRNRIIKLDPP